MCVSKLSVYVHLMSFILCAFMFHPMHVLNLILMAANLAQGFSFLFAAQVLFALSLCVGRAGVVASRGVGVGPAILLSIPRGLTWLVLGRKIFARLSAHRLFLAERAHLENSVLLFVVGRSTHNERRGWGREQRDTQQDQ